MPHISTTMSPDTATAPTTTTRALRPTYHFVCCDTAYCNAPVEDEPPARLTPQDRACTTCVSLALRGVCPTCQQIYP